MEAFLVLLILAALSWICAGPIVVLVLWSRVRNLEVRSENLQRQLHQAEDRLRQAINPRPHQQGAASFGRAAEEADRGSRPRSAEPPVAPEPPVVPEPPAVRQPSVEPAPSASPFGEPVGLERPGAPQPTPAEREAVADHAHADAARADDAPADEAYADDAIADEAAREFDSPVQAEPSPADIGKTHPHAHAAESSHDFGAAPASPGNHATPPYGSTAPPASSPPAGDALPDHGDEQPAVNWEELLAGRWTAWVGALALVIGAGFFFKYAIDQGWIGPAIRVAMGVVTGCCLYAGGIYAMRYNYRFFAQGLVGASLGVLYFSLYAASKWFAQPVLSIEVSFVGMCFATTAALLFAAVFNAQPVAILGLLGGFLTPVMLSTGTDQRWVLFSYLLMLDIGALAVSGYRRWPAVNVLALVFTILMWPGWVERHYAPEKLFDAAFLMTLFWLVFTLLGAWHHLLKRSVARPVDFIILFAAPLSYFSGLLFITHENYEHLHGLLAAIMAVIYVGLALAAIWRLGRDARIPAAFGGLAVIFVTLAIPLQWDGHWVPMAWTVQSLVLFTMALRFGEPKLVQSSLALLGVVQVILVGYALQTILMPRDFSTNWMAGDAVLRLSVPTGPDVRWTDLINGRSLAFLGSAIVACVMAFQTIRRNENRQVIERAAGAVDGQAPVVAASLLYLGVITALVMMVLETYAMWQRLEGLLPSLLSLVAIEAALLALIVAIVWRLRETRRLDRLIVGGFGIAFGLLGLSFLHTLATWRREWGTLNAAADYSGWWSLPLLNPRGWGFAVTIAAAFVVYAISRFRHRRDDYDYDYDLPSDAGNIVGLLAVILGVVYLTAEVYAWGVMQAWGSQTSLAITLLWTLYAIATLLPGIFVRSGALRKFSLLLFALTTAKVFLLDIWQLETTVRTFAFTALGIALLLVSWLYRRHRARIRNWIAGEDRPARE